MSTPKVALILGLFALLAVAHGGPILARLTTGTRAAFKGIFRRLFHRHEGGEIQIGPVVLSDRDRVRHTHIVGATGSGKTVLMESLIYSDLRRGRGAFIIDPKGDRELFERIQYFCRRMGRESDLFLLSAGHIAESARWNPCRLGTPAEIQSKFLNSWTFSEPFYEKACQSALLEVLNVLSREKPQFFLPDVVAALAKKTEKKSPIESLFMDFKNLAESEWGEILCAHPPLKTTRELSLIDAIRKNEIVFIDLPTEGKSVQSSQIGKLLLQEIMLISGNRKTFPHTRSQTPFTIFVDEFDAFATESFATFLNKGRSSNFQIHIGHQTLSDLKAVSDTFLGKVLGNTNVRFVFRQDDPDDAETWSKFFGTALTVKSTYKTSQGSATGDASNRESHEFRIAPDTIKELGIGECIASIKSSRTLAKIRVPIPNPEKLIPRLPLNREAACFNLPESTSDPLKTMLKGVNL